jgi:uncharacterized protein YjbI with pentapeptide repeats
LAAHSGKNMSGPHILGENIIGSKLCGKNMIGSTFWKKNINGSKFWEENMTDSTSEKTTLLAAHSGKKHDWHHILGKKT